jgi:hypothetical protein
MTFLNNPLAGLQTSAQSSQDLEVSTIEESARLRDAQHAHWWAFTPDELSAWRQAVIAVLQENKASNPIDPRIGSAPGLGWKDLRINFQSLGRMTAQANYAAVQLVFKQDPVSEVLHQVNPDAEVDFEYVDVQDNEALSIGSESTEMNWLVRNSAALSRYSGEWLLILGEALLAHSRDFQTIHAEISRRNLASPFVYYVPLNEEANSVTI